MIKVFLNASAFMLTTLALMSCSGGGSSGTSDEQVVNGVTEKNVYFNGNDGSTGFELWKTDGTTANTNLVKDINLQGHSDARFFTQVNNTIFFSANDGVHGAELWKYENDALTLVKDIFPKTVLSESKSHNSNPRNLFVFNNKLYFNAYNGIEYGLWVSDGTESGTLQIASTSMQRPVIFNNALYFTGTGGLWKSDGTAINTSLFIAGVNGYLKSTASSLFFYNSDANGLELWSSNGEVSGTQIVADINPTGDGIANKSSVMYEFNNEIYFTAKDIDGIELWKSDGTQAGTVQVKDITPGTGSSFSTSYSLNITHANNLLFFSASNGVDGNELWVTDGTNAGTRQVTDINGNSSDSIARYTSIISYKDRAVFTAIDDNYTVTPQILRSGSELYISDGTESGTTLIKDIYTGPNSGVNGITQTIFNNELYFMARSLENGYELWKTNGTQNGTVIVKDIRSGSKSSNPSSLYVTDLALFFKADDGVHGAEIWSTSGDSASTVLIGDVNLTSNVSSNATKAVKLSNYDVFFASPATDDAQLYRTDGTTSGTQPILTLETSVYIPGVDLIKLGDYAYFVNSTAATGDELWRTDGTAQGTAIVKDIIPGSAGLNFVHIMKQDGLIYFAATDNTTLTTTIWKTDGSADGTVEISSFNQAYRITHIEVLNGKLIIPLRTAENGIELWVSDGTPQGTKVLKDINIGSTGNGISEYCVNYFGNCNMSIMNNSLFFIATDGSTSRQLWKTDGTTSGTVLVTDLDISGAGVSDYFDSNVFETNGKLLMNGRDTENGGEVWVSDGSSEGTTILKNIQPGNASMYAQFIQFNDKILFVSDTVFGNDSCADPLNCDMGDDIWVSDGTLDGTFGIKAGPEHFASLYGTLFENNKMYFSYKDNASGEELWVTDGTMSGTFMIKDINIGASDGVQLYD